MNYDAYIGLIYSHAKCVCGYNDANVAVMPQLLVFILYTEVEPRMIECGLDTHRLQFLGKFLGFLPAACINYC